LPIARSSAGTPEPEVMAGSKSSASARRPGYVFSVFATIPLFDHA
jgi:hypothetical protein